MKFLETSCGTFVNFDAIQDFHHEWRFCEYKQKDILYSCIKMKNGSILDLFDVPSQFDENFEKEFEVGELIEWHAIAVKYAIRSALEVIRLQEFEDETWGLFYLYLHNKN